MAILLTCIHYWEGKAGASLSPLACGHSCFNCQTWWPFCGESPCLLSLFFWPLSLPRYLKQASGGIDLEVLMLFTVFTFSLCLLVFMTTSFTWKGTLWLVLFLGPPLLEQQCSCRIVSVKALLTKLGPDKIFSPWHCILKNSRFVSLKQ